MISIHQGLSDLSYLFLAPFPMTNEHAVSFCAVFLTLLLLQVFFANVESTSEKLSGIEDICNLTQSVIYNPRSLLQFDGTVLLVAKGPSDHILNSLPAYSRCLLFEGIISTWVPPGARFEYSTFFNYPIALSTADVHNACLFGCVKLLYKLEKRMAVPIYILVVTSAEYSTCSKARIDSRTARPTSCGRLKHGKIPSNFFHGEEKAGEPNTVSLQRLSRIQTQRKQQETHIHSRVVVNHSCIEQTTKFPMYRNLSSENISGQSRQVDICRLVLQIAKLRYYVMTSGSKYAMNFHDSMIEIRGVETSPSVQCLMPIGASQPVQTTEESRDKFVCVFGCDRREYYVRLIGIFVQFIFSSGCIPIYFNPCSRSCSVTVTSARIPIPAVIRVMNKKDDRKAVVRKALWLLRNRKGFSSLSGEQIFKTATKRVRKMLYIVIMWLDIGKAEL